MKRAFTLIELLVVIAIIAILAAILFPVFAQAKAQAKKTASLSNTKQINLAGIMYLNDSDDLYALGFGQNPTSHTWYSGYLMLVPPNWTQQFSPGGVPTSGYAQAAECMYLNSVQPYTKNYQLLVSPGGTTNPYNLTGYTANGVVAEGKTTYSYNGLLQAYNSTAIQSPATVPVLWDGFGDMVADGWGFADPQLSCPNANLPCSYIPCGGSGNGSSGAMYGPSLSDWEFNNGQNWAYADGHSKFRKVGNTLAPADSNPYVEPWVNYNSLGVPNGSYWYDGCFAWLFRPDYVPPNGFN